MAAGKTTVARALAARRLRYRLSVDAANIYAEAGFKQTVEVILQTTVRPRHGV